MSIITTHGLPFLPGNTFLDTTISAFHRPQTLSYKNGYALPQRPKVGIGQQPLFSETLLHNELNPLFNETPCNVSSTSTRTTAVKFIPDYVTFDKKVLRFYGYFQEKAVDSQTESRRVRPVLFYYYLEDDTMCVLEPKVENSGLPQGMLLKRHQMPKNELGQCYHWKDLNLGMDVCLYGTMYRITNCDKFTQDFLKSQGIILNNPEMTPSDSYITRRAKPDYFYNTPSDFDGFKQFLTMDRQVLRFFALFDDSDSVHREKRPVIILYYLVDDSVEIREVQQPNSGRDPYPLLLRRRRIPKDLRTTGKPFPSIILEVSQEEVQEYYSPKDFIVGEEMRIMGKTFLLCDCDDFTLKYYVTHHPELRLNHLPMDSKTQQEAEMVIPPYNGFGSLEDSLQNCLSLVPERPKKDLLKMLGNDHKVLRYTAKLDSQNPQDEGRRFIIHYYLSDDMISIFETPKRNSGMMGGKFLEKRKVTKPGSTPENPKYYGPADFIIGATLDVFRWRFVLIDADQYVLNYLESVAQQERIPEQTLSSLRKALGQNPYPPLDNGTSHSS